MNELSPIHFKALFISHGVCNIFRHEVVKISTSEVVLNVVLLGSLLIPKQHVWFFMSWKNFRPTLLLLVSFSCFLLVILLSVSSLTLFTDVRLLPSTIFNTGHVAFKSSSTLLQNCLPLPVSRICGAPDFKHLEAGSQFFLVSRDFNFKNLMRWFR